MTQEANNSSVQAEIFGQAYTLCGKDPDYIRKLAQYVDSMMRAIAETHPTDSTQLPVLAALNIAHEYHRVKTKLEGGESRKPSPNPFTEEDRQRTRKTRERHHTKRWYEKQLLAIANGDVVPTKEQHDALLAFGQGRGWNRRPPSKR